MCGRKSRQLTLGKYAECSIRKARQQYDECYEQVNDYGRDPLEERQQEKVARKGMPAFSEFMKIYKEFMCLKGKVTIDEEIRALNCHAISVIGCKLLDEVTMNDIDQIQINMLKQAAIHENATRAGIATVKHTLRYVRSNVLRQLR